MLKLKFLGKFREFGLLIIRVGLGVAFMLHGSGKMFHPEMWAGLGGALSVWGITFAPAFWGFMSSFAEFGGGILMILGFLFRPAMAMMAFNMAVALSFHLSKHDDFGVYSHALELGVVFLGLLFVGPGRLSLDGE
jgi:putative oxidoreductase